MDIGMGWYQWQLFGLCGFGWLADKCVRLIPLLSSIVDEPTQYGASSTP